MPDSPVGPSFAAPAGAARHANSAAQGPLLDVRHLSKHFPVLSGIVLRKVVGLVKAVDDVSFTIARGETLGLVGESGCGKSTTARCILRLTPPTSGSIWFEGADLAAMNTRELRAARLKMQVIFQDPYSSLNPRMSIGQIIGEAPRVHGLTRGHKATLQRVQELMELCGLNPNLHTRFPHELSGGQRQRVGIARALSLNPSFIVCDEAVSALDVSIQAQIINLLQELQQRLGLTYLFIAHDLAVVRHMSNRVAVMYLGKMMEVAASRDLYADPLHPYTRALLAAVPIPDPELEARREHLVLKGEVPSPLNPPPGCVFHPRCPLATDVCRQQVPVFEEKRRNHWVACHHV
ncbi:MAG TPA: ABC transporter ATP-binding protein [bacterium]|nr:ABC transporter ATP-binding protein [bacterium]